MRVRYPRTLNPFQDPIQRKRMELDSPCSPTAFPSDVHSQKQTFLSRKQYLKTNWGHFGFRIFQKQMSTDNFFGFISAFYSCNEQKLTGMSPKFAWVQSEEADRKTEEEGVWRGREWSEGSKTTRIALRNMNLRVLDSFRKTHTWRLKRLWSLLSDLIPSSLTASALFLHENSLYRWTTACKRAWNEPWVRTIWTTYLEQHIWTNIFGKLKKVSECRRNVSDHFNEASRRW